MSEIPGDFLECLDVFDARHGPFPRLCCEDMVETSVDVIVNERRLRLNQRPLHRVELLREFHTGAPGLNHGDDFGQMTVRSFQTGNDAGMGSMGRRHSCAPYPPGGDVNAYLGHRCPSVTTWRIFLVHSPQAGAEMQCSIGIDDHGFNVGQGLHQR